MSSADGSGFSDGWLCAMIIEAAVATISRELGSDELFELDRIGIYSTPLWKVKLKAWGAVDLARRFGLRVG